jgi:energy-coupling factor transport system ATP-binding protein
VYLPGDGTAVSGDPADVLAAATVRPPVAELGRLAGWDPLPLSVRDARRRAALLRDTLPAQPPVIGRSRSAGSPAALTARNIVVRYGQLLAVRGADLSLRRGEITALMGRNGSGKSSLLWALQGSGRRDAGTVSVAGAHADPAALPPAATRRLIGLVPQTPADLLYLDTVQAELAQADADAGHSGAEPGGRGQPPPARTILDGIAPGIAPGAHPRDLSAGQQLSLVLAVQLAAAPAVILLDEPTRGLDYQAKANLAGTLGALASSGHAIVIATHDVEFAAVSCDRVIVMAEGEIVADGLAAAALTASPTFAPQVAKILAPLPYLTVQQVAAALDQVAAP